MRNFIMAAVAAACLMGAGSAQAQYYYYQDNPWRWDSWDNRVNSREYRVNSRYDCRALNNMPSFNRLDRNNSNTISPWEFRRLGLSLSDFNRLDRNDDGIIHRWEVRALRQRCY